MLLSSVILVLREVLEAALLFSLLMSLSRRLGISCRWVFLALAVGLLGAAIYGFNIDTVSEAFDGVGQELINAFLQISIYLVLCAIAGFSLAHLRGASISRIVFVTLMTSCVALGIVREGSEIMIYLSGFLSVEYLRVSVLAGSAIGAGIGISVGAVFYYLLLNFGRTMALGVGAALLMLVAAGMASQASLLLIQADWLPSQYPLWDSSWLVSEQSVTGQLLYALVGYEATPTPIQIIAYASSMVLLVAIALILSRILRSGMEASLRGEASRA